MERHCIEILLSKDIEILCSKDIEILFMKNIENLYCKDKQIFCSKHRDRKDIQILRNKDIERACSSACSYLLYIMQIEILLSRSKMPWLGKKPKCSI